MLDWTTSFLSDETIIKPTLGACQILSIGPLDIVVESRYGIYRASWFQKKAPPYERGF